MNFRCYRIGGFDHKIILEMSSEAVYLGIGVRFMMAGVLSIASMCINKYPNEL